MTNSCSDSPKTKYYSKEEAQRIIDSTYEVNLKKIKEDAAIDLKYRSSIEVKEKVDSILSIDNDPTKPNKSIPQPVEISNSATDTNLEDAEIENAQ